MKSVVSVLLVIALAALSHSVAAVASGRFGSVQEEAAVFASLDMDGYVNLLKEARENDAQNIHLADYIVYYSNAGQRVRSSVRDIKIGSVIDCFAFEDQPGLFGGAENKDVARAAFVRARSAKCPPSLVGTRECAPKAENAMDSVCGEGEVAVPRPAVAFGTGAIPRLARQTKKSPQRAPKGQVPPGYSYVDSAFANTSMGTKFTYTILGVGQNVDAPMPSVPILNFVDHSINQMWWVDAFAPVIKTLEGGWIHCAYWSILPDTSIFVFSTPDGYTGNNSANRYNTHGGFIQYPKAPPLGTSRHEVQYMFRYEIMSNNTGFEMWLRPFTYDGSQNAYKFGDWIALGYWPINHYINSKAPNFDQLQCGQELDRSSPSSQLTAGGKIFGWGTNTDRYPIYGNFTNYGHKISFSYGNKPLFEKNPYSANHWVKFTGPEQ